MIALASIILAIISAASDYLYVGGLDEIQIDGGILPLRQDKQVLRGEDIAFLKEATAERNLAFEGELTDTHTAGKNISISTLPNVFARYAYSLQFLNANIALSDQETCDELYQPPYIYTPKVYRQNYPSLTDAQFYAPTSIFPTFDALKASGIAEWYTNVANRTLIFRTIGLQVTNADRQFNYTAWRKTRYGTEQEYTRDVAGSEGYRIIEDYRATVNGYSIPSSEFTYSIEWDKGIIETFGGTDTALTVNGIPPGAKVFPVVQWRFDEIYNYYPLKSQSASDYDHQTRYGYATKTNNVKVAGAAALNTLTWNWSELGNGLHNIASPYRSYYWNPPPAKEVLTENDFMTQGGERKNNYNTRGCYDVEIKPVAVIIELGQHTRW